jgi:pseudo-rSAM protein
MIEYFRVEPYVFINKNDQKILFYNTIDGIYLEYYFHNEIWTISENILIVKFERPNDLYDQFKIDLADKKMAFKFLGDKVFAPNMFNKIEIEFKRQLELNKAKDNDELMQCVTNITICANGAISTLKNLNFLKLQFDIFSNADKGRKQISFDTIKHLFSKISFPNLVSISITGSLLYRNASFNNFLIFLKTLYKVKLFISYSEYTKNLYTHMPEIEYHIICDDVFFEKFPHEYEKFIDKEVCFHLYLSNNDELNFLETNETKINLFKFHLEPYYSNNYPFLSQLISYTKEGLFENKKSMLKIIRNNFINELFFGSLVIHNDGDVFSNIQSSSLGNIESDKFPEILYNASQDKKSWLYSRSTYIHCNKCLFNSLCPSLTLIELTSNFVFCKSII